MILVGDLGTKSIVLNLDENIDRRWRWIDLSQNNANQFIFGRFINEILRDIEIHHVPDNYDDTRIYIWGNLRAHQTSYVTKIVEYRAS